MEKITRLVTTWPKGTAALTAHLNKIGYENDLLTRYVKGSWLESLGYGAYKLAKDRLSWEGAVYAMQNQSESTVHPGGMTALELKGFAHYYNVQGSKKTDLFGNYQEKLPKWFLSQTFSSNIRYTKTNLFDYLNLRAYSTVKSGTITLKISSPELAILELLYLVPKYYTFEESYLIMEGLTTLRSDLVQCLLEKCGSIKVKRLFLYMAERNGHLWFKDLQADKLDLGKGKREIVKKGRLNSKYGITVPREYEG